MRLIDADDLLKDKHKIYIFYNEDYISVRDIESAPTVDEVPVEILQQLEKHQEYVDGDYKARRALIAVSTVISYLKAEETFASNTEWVDTKGYAMDCDLGYFYEGLENFRDLLVKRLRKAVPRYRQACEKYFEEPHKCGDCEDYHICEEYVDPSETFPEVGGCQAFKAKKEAINDKP